MGCFFALQRAVAPCLNGCLFPTALFASRLNCRSRGGAEICLVSQWMFIPDSTSVLVTKYYILTRRNGQILNTAVCSATSVESCLCLKAPREFLSYSVIKSGGYAAVAAALFMGAFIVTPDVLWSHAYKYVAPYFISGYYYAKNQKKWLKSNMVGGTSALFWAVLMLFYSKDR